MATSTQSGGGTSTRTSTPSWFGSFALYVSLKTGLRVDVIKAWYLAEGGPRDNPLNIGPGRHYGDPVTAAKATVQLLQSSRYAPIRKAAQTGNAQAQLNAIARSPWDAGHYGGNGQNLRGAYQRVLRESGGTGAPAATLPASDVSAVTPDVGAWISQLTGWAEGAALRALAYIILTVAAIALFVLGLERTLGGSPLTRTNPNPLNPIEAGVPF